jgi:hypothetical protein
MAIVKGAIRAQLIRNEEIKAQKTKPARKQRKKRSGINMSAIQHNHCMDSWR